MKEKLSKEDALIFKEELENHKEPNEYLKEAYKEYKKIKIELIHWDYTCGDGCCTDYGVRLKMNGEELEHPDSTDDSYISNNYMGDDVDTALRAVLKKLGYEVEIITRHEED